MEADWRRARETAYALGLVVLAITAMDAWPKPPVQTVAEVANPGPEHGPMPTLVCVEPGPLPRWTIDGATVERAPLPMGPYRTPDEARLMAALERGRRELDRERGDCLPAAGYGGTAYTVASYYPTGYYPPSQLVPMVSSLAPYRSVGMFSPMFVPMQTIDFYPNRATVIQSRLASPRLNLFNPRR